MNEKLEFISSLADAEFHRALLRMDIAMHRTALNIQQTWEKATKRIDASAGQLLSSASSRFLTIGGAAAVLGAGLMQVAKAGDEVALGIARIGAVTGDAEGAAQAIARLQGLSAETGANIGDAVGQFSRFTIAAKQIGASSDDVIKLIELIQKAGLVSGATSQELGAAGVQLGQALASGRFQGDELRSIMENLPILAEALARNLGVSVGELREMGKEGQLTTDVVFPALLKASEEMSEKFAAMPETMGRAWDKFIANAKQGAAELDKMLKLSQSIAFLLNSATKGTEEFFNEKLLGAEQTEFMRAQANTGEKPNVIPGLNAPLSGGGDSRSKAQIKAAEQFDRELEKMNSEAAKERDDLAKRQIQAAKQIEEHAERTAKIYRDLYKDGLNDAEKLAFLDRERAIIAKQLEHASGVERARLKEKLADKNAEWLAEKRIQAEKARQKQFEEISNKLEKARTKLSEIKDKQLARELMTPDERREDIREERRIKRAQDRIDRVAKSRRENGGRDTRPGSNAIANEVALTTDSITKLANQLAMLVPK